MYCGPTLPTAILLVATTVAVTNKPVEGFSTPTDMSSCFRKCATSPFDAACRNTNAERGLTPTILFGILDDIMEEDSALDSEQNNSDTDEQLTELYHSLIFASDLQSEISRQMDGCTDPKFIEYLNASSESSQDEEERQGLTELIDQIDQVREMMAKKAADDQEKAALAAKAEEERENESRDAAAAAAPSNESTKALTNADVLRKAQEIDAAIALSDDEKPSDFISDCREVVNLSRGFNDSGRMRVGGR